MATTTTGPVWGDHTQGGQSFSVGHLHPVFLTHEISAVPATKSKPGRAAMTAILRIFYSHHCFTQALEKVAAANPDHYYNCTRRPKDPRVFCLDRWTESKALPSIWTGIGNCYFTRHHNYFVVRNPTNPLLGDYFVYFAVRANSSGFVDIEIESAYPRLDGAREKGASKVSFTVLVANALRGVRTRKP